jgi:hypothetical protein
MNETMEIIEPSGLVTLNPDPKLWSQPQSQGEAQREAVSVEGSTFFWPLRGSDEPGNPPRSEIMVTAAISGGRLSDRGPLHETEKASPFLSFQHRVFFRIGVN